MHISVLHCVSGSYIPPAVHAACVSPAPAHGPDGECSWAKYLRLICMSAKAVFLCDLLTSGTADQNLLELKYLSLYLLSFSLHL